MSKPSLRIIAKGQTVQVNSRSIEMRIWPNPAFERDAARSAEPLNITLATMKLSSLVIASTTLLCAAALSAAEKAISFEGRYEYRADSESLEMLGEQVCFFPSKLSSQNVPRPTGDCRGSASQTRNKRHIYLVSS